MGKFKTIIIVFLLGACVLSMSRYITAIRENSSLQASIEKQIEQLNTLEMEKQNLLESLDKEKKALKEASRKNTLFKVNLKAATKRVNLLFNDNSAVKDDLKELNTQVSMLKAENEAIRTQAYKLKFDLIDLERQKEELENRFNSLPELKKAIKELKKKGPQAREREKLSDLEPQGDYAGNRGFLMKNGEATEPESKVRIEVSPDFEAGAQ